MWDLDTRSVMSVGFSKRNPPPPPLETPLWTMTKDTRSITAWSRVSSEVDGVEIVFTLNGELYASYRYPPHTLWKVKPDLDAKHDALLGSGWQRG